MAKGAEAAPLQSAGEKDGRVAAAADNRAEPADATFGTGTAVLTIGQEGGCERESKSAALWVNWARF